MIAHAAALSSLGTVSDTHVVVLESPDESSLEKLERTLIREKIEHTVFREPDAPWNNARMAVGINPIIDRREVRRFLKSFNLLT